MSTPERTPEERRLSRLTWVMSEATKAIKIPLSVATIGALSKAMCKVCEEQGIWFIWRDSFEDELQELIREKGGK